MTTPKRPIHTDEDVDAKLRAWLAHGPRVAVRAGPPARAHLGRSNPAGVGVAGANRAGPKPKRGAIRVRRGRGGPDHDDRARLGRRTSDRHWRPARVGVRLAAALVASPEREAEREPQAPRRRRTRSSRAPCSAGVAATGATYQVRYPQVGGLADAAAAATIDRLLRDQADVAIRDFTSGIGKDPQAGPNQPSTLQVDYSVAFSSPDVLSLRVNSYSYPRGPPTAPTCSALSPSTWRPAGAMRSPTCSAWAAATWTRSRSRRGHSSR